jgi:enamine deaminase RidA (YjgF/YER057c/UK114 family)
MKNLLPIIALLAAGYSARAQNIDFDKKLKDLGIALVTPKKPIATYVKAVRTGNLLFLSGDGPTLTGKVGKDITTEQAYGAARETGISILSTLKAELGDLNKVKRIVKATGMVNCTSDFIDQSKVINGFSDLMVQVFGDKGKHARSAIGVYALPRNFALEIEIVVEVED